MEERRGLGIGAKILLLLLVSSVATISIGLTVFVMNNSLSKNFYIIRNSFPMLRRFSIMMKY